MYCLLFGDFKTYIQILEIQNWKSMVAKSMKGAPILNNNFLGTYSEFGSSYREELLSNDKHTCLQSVDYSKCAVICVPA